MCSCSTRSRSIGRSPQRLVRARVDLREPAVELVLEVELVGEHAARFEVGLRVALQALDAALGLRIGRLAELPARPSAARRSAANASDRAPAVAVDAGLAIPDQRPAATRPAAAGSRRSRPADPRSASRTPARPRRRASSPGTRTRPSRGASGRARPAPPRAAARHRTGRPRPAGRPCAETSSARRREQRPDLAQVVIDDRLARPAAQRLQQLADPDAGQLRVLAQQPVDLVLKRLQHAPARRPRIARRPLAPQRPPDRVAREPRRSRELLDRLPSDEMLASQLSPLLHLDHPSSRPSRRRQRRDSAPPRTTPPPAQGGQFSSGGGGSVFTRRRHRTPVIGATRVGTNYVRRAPHGLRTPDLDQPLPLAYVIGTVVAAWIAS